MSGRELPAVSWAALKTSGKMPSLPANTTPFVIRYTIAGTAGDFPGPVPSTAKFVLDQRKDSGWSHGILTDKIVLLGGHYDAGDEHQTPIGWMFGVDILGHVIDTELQGGGREPASNLKIYSIAVVASALLWLMIRTLRLSQVLIVAPILIVVLALFCSLVVTSSVSASHALLFGLVLTAVLGQQIWMRMSDQAKHPETPESKERTR